MPAIVANTSSEMMISPKELTITAPIFLPPFCRIMIKLNEFMQHPMYDEYPF
jgi:hypothetical protein